MWGWNWDFFKDKAITCDDYYVMDGRKMSFLLPISEFLGRYLEDMKNYVDSWRNMQVRKLHVKIPIKDFAIFDFEWICMVLIKHLYGFNVNFNLIFELLKSVNFF